MGIFKIWLECRLNPTKMSCIHIEKDLKGDDYHV